MKWKVSYLSKLGEEIGRLQRVEADLAEGEGNEHGSQEVSDGEVKGPVLRQPAPSLQHRQDNRPGAQEHNHHCHQPDALLISFTRYILPSLLVLQTGRDRDDVEDCTTTGPINKPDARKTFSVMLTDLNSQTKCKRCM